MKWADTHQPVSPEHAEIFDRHMRRLAESFVHFGVSAGVAADALREFGKAFKDMAFDVCVEAQAERAALRKRWGWFVIFNRTWWRWWRLERAFRAPPR